MPQCKAHGFLPGFFCDGGGDHQQKKKQLQKRRNQEPLQLLQLLISEHDRPSE